MNHSLPEIILAATLDRKEFPEHARGCVLVRKGPEGQYAAVNWHLDPPARGYAPGIYRVDAQDRVALAVGGDAKTGAARWAVILPAARPLKGVEEKSAQGAEGLCGKVAGPGGEKVGGGDELRRVRETEGVRPFVGGPFAGRPLIFRGVCAEGDGGFRVAVGEISSNTCQPQGDLKGEMR